MPTDRSGQVRRVAGAQLVAPPLQEQVQTITSFNSRRPEVRSLILARARFTQRYDGHRCR